MRIALFVYIHILHVFVYRPENFRTVKMNDQIPVLCGLYRSFFKKRS